MMTRWASISASTAVPLFLISRPTEASRLDHRHRGRHGEGGVGVPVLRFPESTKSGSLSSALGRSLYQLIAERDARHKTNHKRERPQKTQAKTSNNTTTVTNTQTLNAAPLRPETRHGCFRPPLLLQQQQRRRRQARACCGFPDDRAWRGGRDGAQLAQVFRPDILSASPCHDEAGEKTMQNILAAG